MAVVEDRVVRAVSLLDLVERLREEECLEAVARHERQGGLEEVEPAERGKLIQHQQYAMAVPLRGQLLGQPPPDLVEDEADERLGPRDVARRHDQIQRRRSLSLDQIRYAPLAGPLDLQLGRASCRERVGQSVTISVVAE